MNFFHFEELGFKELRKYKIERRNHPIFEVRKPKRVQSPFCQGELIVLISQNYSFRNHQVISYKPAIVNPWRKIAGPEIETVNTFSMIICFKQKLSHPTYLAMFLAFLKLRDYVLRALTHSFF